MVFRVEEDIKGSTTPSFFGACPVRAFLAAAGFSAQAQSELPTTVCRRDGCRMCSISSYSIPFSSVERTEASISCCAFFAESVACMYTWWIVEIVVAIADELFQVVDIWSFWCWMGLIQTDFAVAHLIYGWSRRQVSQWLAGCHHYLIFNGH